MKLSHMSVTPGLAGTTISVQIDAPTTNISEAIYSVLALFAWANANAEDDAAREAMQAKRTEAQASSLGSATGAEIEARQSEAPKVAEATPAGRRPRTRPAAPPAAPVETAEAPKVDMSADIATIGAATTRRRRAEPSTPPADPIITDADLAKAASQAGSTPGVGPDVVMLVVQDFCKDLNLSSPPTVNDIPQLKRKQFLFELQEEINLAVEEAKTTA